MNKNFYRFMIIVLLTFVGVGILGSGQAFASGNSFNVPHVNDHFEKVQQDPAPMKEAPVTPTPQKEKTMELGIGLLNQSRKHGIGQRKLSPVYGIKQRKSVPKHGTGFVRSVIRSRKSL
jgi:hypothetical protein